MYEHHRELLEASPSRMLLAWGTGAGKTRGALLLALKHSNSALIVTPKTQKDDRNWQRELEKMGRSDYPVTVVSREEFRRDWKILPPFDCLIIDESHTMTTVYAQTMQRRGVQVVKYSGIMEALLGYCDKHRPKYRYLCSATPDRTPLTVYGHARLLGNEWNFHQFRDAFYKPVQMAGRYVAIWIEKKDTDTRERLGRAVRKIGSVKRLDDLFDVPEQLDHVDLVPQSTETKVSLREAKLTHPEPLRYFTHAHQLEQGDKIPLLLDYAIEFPKILIFARYREQINTIQDALTEVGHTVLTLTGDTKDREKVIVKMNSLKKCILIASSDIAEGYELPDTPCVIFASLSFSWVKHEQGRGRVLRANALKKNLYVYLVAKGVDTRVYNTIKQKQDFSMKKYEES